MTSQQQADLLLACWQAMPETPPEERLTRIDFIRRSMLRPEANDNDYGSLAAVREAIKTSAHVAGSSLRHYMPASRDDLRRAMREVIAAARTQGSEHGS